MAETTHIPSDMLVSGDLVDVEYRIVGDNEAQLALGIKAVKDALWADGRFDYQSGWIEERTEWSGGSIGAGSLMNYRYLVVRLIVRKSLRKTSDATAETYEANVVGGIVVAIVAVVMLVTGAIVTCKVLDYKGIKVQQLANIAHDEATKAIVESDLPENAKIEALKLQEAAAQAAAKETTIGSGLAAIGSSLGMAVIIIAVLWVLTHARSGGHYEV